MRPAGPSSSPTRRWNPSHPWCCRSSRVICCGAETRPRSSRTTARCLSGTPISRRSAGSGSGYSRLHRTPRRRRPRDDMDAAVADTEAKFPGLLGYMDPSDPGMHTTDTIDFEVVLEGKIVLELDDGAEVHPESRGHGGAERHSPSLAEPGRQAGPAGVVHVRRVPRERASGLIRSGARDPRSRAAPACRRHRQRGSRRSTRG